MAKVTVITGYYNRGHALRKTLDSVLRQTFIDFEFIVFDDCSTDGTSDKLEKLAEEYNDHRLILRIHNKNTGFVQGMINAVNSTDSDYIAVQGSGDISLPLRLEKQVKLLDMNPDVGVVGCWYTNISEDLDLKRIRRPSKERCTFKDLMQNNIYSHGEVIFRRDKYYECGGYRKQFKYCQDYDLWLRMSKISKLSVVEECLYERFIRFDGASYKPEKLVDQTMYSILCKQLASGSINLEITDNDFNIRNLIPIETVEVQSTLFKAALRSSLLGGHNESNEISEHLTSSLKKIIINFCNAITSNSIAEKLLMPTLYRFLGFNR